MFRNVYLSLLLFVIINVQLIAAPFALNPDEQKELDEFLVRWENFNATIKRFDVGFYLLEYDPAIPGVAPNTPYRICFGFFVYAADPKRLRFDIEGEWRDGKRMTRRENPHIHAGTMIIRERSIFKYNHNFQMVLQINASPEMIETKIANCPLVLTFGGKADDLKQRFSMKIERRPEGNIVLHARPLLVENHREFRELVMLLDGETLYPRGLKLYDRGTGYKVFQLNNVRIRSMAAGNPEAILIFTPVIPQDWRRETFDWEDGQPFCILRMIMTQKRIF